MVVNEPTSCLVQPIGTHGVDIMYFGCVCFRGELGFLNCDDICMCVVNKQLELLEFDSVYVDLQYVLLLGMCPCDVSVVLWSSLVCLLGCRDTLCGCGSCCECDACTVTVVCVYAERV